VLINNTKTEAEGTVLYYDWQLPLMLLINITNKCKGPETRHLL